MSAAAYLAVRSGSTSGPYIVERARPDWRRSMADIAGCFRSKAAAQKAADNANAADACGCTGFEACDICAQSRA